MGLKEKAVPEGWRGCIHMAPWSMWIRVRTPQESSRTPPPTCLGDCAAQNGTSGFWKEGLAAGLFVPPRGVNICEFTKRKEKTSIETMPDTIEMTPVYCL